jgi:hypothetical protein
VNTVLEGKDNSDEDEEERRAHLNDLPENPFFKYGALLGILLCCTFFIYLISSSSVLVWFGLL